MTGVACDGSSPKNRVDSAGISIVTSDNAGEWKDSERPTITQVVTIGSVQDSLYQFGSIRGLDISENGTIAVLDAQPASIRLYDSTGVYLKSVGRTGRGPGELGGYVDDLMFGNGDTLLVAAGAKSSVTRLLLTGESLQSFDIPEDANQSSVQLDTRWQKHPMGGAVQQVVGRPRDSSEVYPPYHLVRLTASGTIDTIFTLPGGRTVQPDDSVAKTRTGNRASMVSGEHAAEPEVRIFAPEPVWTIASNGAVHYAMSSDYAIHMYDSTGALKRIVRRPIKAQPLTESDQKAGQDMVRKAMSGDGLSGEEIEDLLRGFKFANEFPILIRMIGGPGGSLWVQRANDKIDFSSIALDRGLEAFASPVWDVFAGDGTFMGPVRLPSGFVPMRWVGDRLLGVVHDSDNVQTVAVLRAEPQGALRSLRR